LDIGTGTGDWAIEMGDAYPNATIEGTDLSPIQPTDVPANVQFVIDDAEQEDWAVPENHYDYIHTRFMMGCFADFREIIKQGFKHTKPGGWMESQDLMHPPFCDDGTMPDDWPFKDWSDTMDDASEKANRRLTIAHKLKRWYIEAGFVDVHEKIIKMPINSWPRNKHLKTLGKFWAENLLAGLQGFSLALFSREFMWSKTEIEVCVLKGFSILVAILTRIAGLSRQRPQIHHRPSRPRLSQILHCLRPQTRALSRRRTWRLNPHKPKSYRSKSF
jgi:hypothetical protein